MATLSKRHFWEWFERHQQDFLHLPTKSNKEVNYWKNELNAHLRAYYKFLLYCIDWPTENNGRLVISVNGNTRRFKKAERLISMAPEIAGWTFIALDPPRDMEFSLEKEMQELLVDPHEFQFRIEKNSDSRFSLYIFHPLCTTDNVHEFHYLADRAVYNLLGERTYGLSVVKIETDNLSNAETNDLLALEELPQHITQNNSGFIVDSQGNLINFQ